MQLEIHHLTTYRYESPLRLSTQYLRLTPRPTPGSQVLDWRLDLPAPAVALDDPWGNRMHVLTLEGMGREIRLQAQGRVHTADQPGPEPDGALPPAVFLRPTPLTAPDQALIDFAEAHRAAFQADPRRGAEQLMAQLLGRMPYTQGMTDAATPATQAFAAASGVCQDHAQVFIAMARHLGLPARYVSGYLATDAEHVASHAWVELRLAEGWCGLDISNQRWVDGQHVRLAYGADYLDACPVRGVRSGGGLEELATFVRVSAAAPPAPDQ